LFVEQDYNNHVTRNLVAYNEYQRTYQLARYHRRKEAAKRFLGGKCVRCGATEQLEVDHVDPAQKSFNISNLWAVTEDRFYAELRKCQLLCRPHHLEKTAAENSVDHGGGASGKKNCPCVLCKQKKAEYMASYRKGGR
jgi:5-methylcytosine-specific restriction endonuclease McrA